MSAPTILAWEVTRACTLKCLHCRASSIPDPEPDELTTQEGFSLLDQLAREGTRMVILSGGDPLLRQDIFDFAQHGSSRGLRMTMATNGSLITEETASRILDSGIVRVSISLDGVTPEIHDEFRGMPGAFESALRGIDILSGAGIPFQVNTTVASMNVREMEHFPDFVRSLGAVAWHVFFLVPTGRGQTLEPATVKQYRDTLEAFYDVYMHAGIECKATCAPQFYRILAQKGEEVTTRGCLAGTGFGFVSSRGIVQPCGFLQMNCGSIRVSSFAEIWENSPILRSLREFGELKGSCGTCTFRDVCGGCRARAYEILNDVMEVDPICWFPQEDSIHGRHR
ncbi:MAG: radical SAM protein [Desulfomonilia bacterium]